MAACLLRVSLALSILISVQPLWAQIDPSAALLLRSGSGEPPKVPLDSGRYTVRPTPQSDPTPKPVPPRVQSKVESIVTPKVDPVKPASNGAPEVVSEPLISEPAPSPAVVIPTPDHNLVELSFSPAFIYSGSSSNYWFRDYYSSGPGFALGALIWPTEGFGLAMNFQTSFNSTISDSPGSKNKEAAEHQWFSSGLRFRKLFGGTKRKSSVTFGLDYAEYQMHIPPDAIQRIGVKTVGAQLSLEASIPTSATFSWQLGGLILPRSDHQETPTTVNVKSGERNDSATVGVWIGGTHMFDRRNQIFWSFRHSVERNVYEGAATVADPATGLNPEGVSVQQSLSVFQFGYRWGN